MMWKEGMHSRQFDEIFDKGFDDRVSQLVMRFPNASIVIFYFFCPNNVS